MNSIRSMIKCDGHKSFQFRKYDPYDAAITRLACVIPMRRTMTPPKSSIITSPDGKEIYYTGADTRSDPRNRSDYLTENDLSDEIEYLATSIDPADTPQKWAMDWGYEFTPKLESALNDAIKTYKLHRAGKE